jgi:hypothetical protein
VKKGEPGRKHNLVIARGPHAFQTISGALLLRKPAKNTALKSSLATGENLLPWRINLCGKVLFMVQLCLCAILLLFLQPLDFIQKKKKEKRKRKKQLFFVL